MPMLTTARMGSPVAPVHRPLRTASTKAAMRSSSVWTSAPTSAPSTSKRSPAGRRRAVWSTARPSLSLMGAPANIWSRRSSSPAARARSLSREMVSAVIQFFDRSTRSPAASRVRPPARPGSAAKR